MLINPGAMIRNARQPEFGGTLGCVVVARDDPARRYVLTAAHVIGLGGYARHGDAIEARVAAEDRWVKIGEFDTAVKLRDAPGVLQDCDAAIARITDDSLVGDEIEGLGTPLGTAPQIFEDKRLQFRGAHSGLVTGAQVQSTGNVVPVTYDDIATGGTFTLRFRRQIVYGVRSGDVWRPATIEQDSGALILDRDGLAVGLHVGRTPDAFEIAASICTPIDIVLDALGVRLPASRDGSTSPAAGAAAGAGAAPGPAARPDAMPSSDRVGIASFDAIGVSLRSLLEPHNPFGGCLWQLSPDGLIVDGRLDRSVGVLVTVPRVWAAFAGPIRASAARHGVPVELIVATICTESSGRADAVRREPGFISVSATPHRISVGLMQTLISTAREATGNPALDDTVLLDPATSIDAGTAYIAGQRTRTNFDPPLVACAYNAGGLFLNEGAANRWKIRQFPIGTGAHADRYTQWFNDCFAFFLGRPEQVPRDAPSLFALQRP